MLPFNEIGHAREERLVVDGVENQESWTCCGLELKLGEGLNRTALGVAGKNKN